MRVYLSAVLLLFLLFLACAASLPATAADADPWNMAGKQFRRTPLKIVFFGDSVLAGHGLLNAEDSAAGIIEQTLEKQHHFDHDILFKNLSHPGMTTSEAVKHMNNVVALKPDILVLALGMNDALQGVDPDIVYNNLNYILKDIKKANIYTLFVGMQAPRKAGYSYISRFNSVYGHLSQQHDVTFMPFLRKGVADDRVLLLSDGIYPNRRGHEVIANNLSGYLYQMLKRQKRLKDDLEEERRWRRIMRKRNQRALEDGLPPKYSQEEIERGVNPGH